MLNLAQILPLPLANGITVYLAEEQQIYREAYQPALLPRFGLEVVGGTEDTSAEALVAAASVLKPDVLLLGIQALRPVIVERLMKVRASCPKLAIALLSTCYDVKAIQALRGFSLEASAGYAYLLKHTIDTAEHLARVLHLIARDGS